MAYSSPYDFNEDSILRLDEKFSEVSNDRFFYCIQDQQNWTIDKVNNIISKFRTSHQYTLRELDRLEELDKTYNKHHYTNHRKYVTTAQEVVSKMRCTLSGLKKVVTEFRNKGKNKKDTTLMDDTALYNGPYMKNAFGMESYFDTCVQDLQTELNSFLADAEKCVDKAVKMISDERAISQNPELAYALYQNDYTHSIADNHTLITMIDNQRPDLENDFVKALEEAEDAKKLIAKLYHTFNRDKFNYNSACVAIHEGHKVDLTREESLIWGRENEKKVKRLRLLLDHIQEFIEANLMNNVIGWRGMLKGYFVMRLLFWCGWKGTKNNAMLNYITKRCEGIIGVVKMGAVLSEKNKLANISRSEDEKRQKTFNTTIDSFVDSLIQKEQPQDN